MGARILVVEDDDAIATGLVRVLDAQGYEVRRVASGHQALDVVDDGTVLVLLDLGLPDVDGVEVCRRLRRRYQQVGVLIVSARDQELDVVAGLDAGADDYLVKPFRLSELLARVRAHVRRREIPDVPATAMQASGVTVDAAARRAFRDGRELALRPREFELLAVLVGAAGRVVTRDRLMREVWDTDWMGSTKTLDTHVLTLRQKLGQPDLITTLRGVGYRFEDECAGG